jgi:starch phosphorylase
MAKLIIRLILAVGEIINRDAAVQDRIKVVFLPNFNVGIGQRVYPAAELSEQISTAGKEASGTGNMKFCMNGALTIGTLDGANVEIRELVGKENFFLFGLTAEEVQQRKVQGYHPRDIYQSNPLFESVIDLIRDGSFSRGDRELFRPIVDNLLYDDPYMLLADFQSYIDCQNHVGDVYRDKEQWTRMSIFNTARSGYFSSDRTIREYCEDIWKVGSVPVELLSNRDIRAGIAEA